MITVDEADRLLRERIAPLSAERVALADAEGRVLREDLAADRDYPPFDRVAMDGIAIHVTGAPHVRRFAVEGLQRAGEPPQTLSRADGCIEIMTGAVLPAGCDTVVRYEDLQMEHGVAALLDGTAVVPRQNIHVRGSDRRAGERILAAGTRLGAPHIAVAASIGRAELLVVPRLRFAVVTTGDELVDVDAPVLPHQIRKSNALAIRAALVRYGAAAVHLLHARDTEADLRAALAAALANSDVVLLSGGVSMGKFDLVPQVLAGAGVQNVFHKVAQKPGKPLWFGVRPDGRPVFGLPGNPVSALVCLYRYVLPLLDSQAGLQSPSRLTLLAGALPKAKHGLTLFAPVTRDGLRAIFIKDNGSGDFASLAESDGFVEIRPEGNREAPGGYELPFYPWSLA